MSVGIPTIQETIMNELLTRSPTLSPKIALVITRICMEKQKDNDLPNINALKRLAALEEEVGLEIVNKILKSPNPIKTLSGYIHFLINRLPNAGATTPPPQVAIISTPPSSFKRQLPSPTSLPHYGESSGYQNLERQLQMGCPSVPDIQIERPSKVRRQLQFFSEPECSVKQPLPPKVSSEPECSETKEVVSYQRIRLSEQLEFRKLFLIYTYIGRREFEDAVSKEDADKILDEMKDLPMREFESRMWNGYGVRNVKPQDRIQSTLWDSGKTHVYCCTIYQDGSFSFKGPCLNNTSTHLQRSLGDDNILIVKFVEDGRYCTDQILKEGILVGLRTYRFFVFKSEGKGRKKEKETENDEVPLSSVVRCYFVNYDSVPARGDREAYDSCPAHLNKARCHFMHVHMVPSLAKYMARFSLILSQTIKLPFDLSDVDIDFIKDTPCLDENGDIVLDEDGKECILTDGTGFISEALALKCPKNFCSAKFLEDIDFENQDGGDKSWNREPPLLIQCRIFSKGLAVKGTLLINRKLEARKIQVRSSMVKVERDKSCPATSAFDSLEIVAVSHKPRKCQLSKYLIALLSYGGVPRDFFLDILRNALEETQALFTKLNAALRVSMRNRDMDDGGTTARMLLAGVPLSEPYLQDRLVKLAYSERKSLKEGKLPITESFYLMGTVDPTGRLKPNEVCVILENGQISGKVLVYRNPGLHFGDIHVLEAVYVKELEEIIGNGKFGIFFSTKGQRSVATEIANGDFDGDMYWVSRNPQLLRFFKPSEPWSRVYPSASAESKDPKEFSPQELESELFRLFLEKRKPCYNMSTAADSWLVLMDRLLVLRDENDREPDDLRQKMLKLVDIYYDALDAPKSGKKVNVPFDLKAQSYPHYMGKASNSSYHSTSILGDIFDKAEQFQPEIRSIGGISKQPCFDSHAPEDCLILWRRRYDDYRHDMQEALNDNQNSEAAKKAAANAVYKKYKEMLYEAAELEESKKDMERINAEALAIYHVCYDFAIGQGSYRKCGFAWRVAGAALCRIHATRCSTNEYPMMVAPSVLRNCLF